MIATLIAILSLIVLGIPITLAVDRRARGPLLLGASFFYGSGAMFLVLLALSVLHIRWTLISVTVCALAVFCAASLLARRRTTGNRQRAAGAHVFDLATLLTLTGYGLDATLVSLGAWDFWAIWGLKGKVFLEMGGIDWRFLESRWNVFFHPDYPVLVPLNFDLIALVNGGWSDRWLGLLFVAWAAALLLVVRALAARETTPFFASLLTFSLASLAVSPWVGYAEGPLIAFGGAGILFVRAALRDDDAASWRHGALMLGFAANCKNEGLALLVAVTIGVAVAGSRGLGGLFFRRKTSRPRNLATARLWPAYALAAPWLLLRLMHTLPTDIASGSTLSRLMARLPYLHQVLALLGAQLTEPWFWIAILAGILVAPSAARRGELFVFLVTAIQLFFYVAAYVVTPNDLHWHVLTSWSRLTSHIAVPITFAVFLMLAKSLRGSQDAPHAEARPDE
ncbi:MAG: hypothetical protein QOC81_1233 [Thermoanaerobaculia bacterium]|jgi:hypothetical protein|nr:hypothetical protein [Thermoanaerobaculia bacterium]